jgi:Tfp pilus assembly protein PilF
MSSHIIFSFRASRAAQFCGGVLAVLLLGVRVARAQGDRVGAQRYARKRQLGFPGIDQARALAQLDHPG